MDREAPKIWIIILNWNGKKDTLECLDSVQKIDYPNYQILVVDNGSTDDSIEAIKEKFPSVSIVENITNLGFAAGNNEGIKYAIARGADYVFLLNNDTVVDSQVLWTLVKASLKYPKAGILGSKIYFYGQPQTIWFAGGEWLAEDAMFKHSGNGEIDDGKNWSTIQETGYICGCAFFVKAKVIEKVGMFEPKYFLMWEEVDWCSRTKKAGYQCLFVPDSKVWHKISSSFTDRDRAAHYHYFWFRNRLLWIERNVKFTEAVGLYKVIFRDIYRQIRKYINPQTNIYERMKAKAILQATNDYFFRQFWDCPKWVRSPIEKK